MKKLSEYKDDEALDLLADMLDPLVSMSKNEEFMSKLNNEKATRLEIVQSAIRSCKHEIMHILAILNGVPVEEYHCSIASIMSDATYLFKDKDFIGFFESQSQKNTDDASGSVTENTEEKEK